MDAKTRKGKVGKKQGVHTVSKNINSQRTIHDNFRSYWEKMPYLLQCLCISQPFNMCKTVLLFVVSFTGFLSFVFFLVVFFFFK